ncbi:MAG: Rieske 2Fe-2S domain-containing protein [Nitrospina sp.]|jgi:nitrite reductase/ring-hydroxylating ferredoxin subunit|nr:Rieske 2Fe-2S domain-containing protein [Nitrospina sp.]MBT3875702.1 Rieske 2Fe-2S domain-containing protein [Nitrospina sp.]MBT4048462.1 Rieske 2Fe-2S domain-containing protein [Nitrospina sp.]MBT5349881.1 Rieske 2Fe-2S domain-containing protein [Nitrospina sp.]MBT5652304.1 Rieske 2Fe-2S domain-containing protein [Nitrospina sp.]
MFLGKEGIEEKIKSSGYVFSHFTMVEEGNFSLEDADWNYRDLLHIPFWHKIDYTVAHAEENVCTAFWMTKILGIPLPMMLMSYRPTPNSHSATTAFFFIVVISFVTFEEITPYRTRTTSRYSFGVPRWLRWMAPLLVMYFKSSCKRLATEDIPIRERRCELRKLGYSFLSDDLNTGFEKSMDLDLINVIPPKDLPEKNELELSLEEIFKTSDTYLLGTDDIYGLRLIKDKEKLNIFPRMCDHEGMSLDNSRCIKNRIKCPVHGKAFRPLTSLEINSKGLSSYESSFHEFILKNNTLHISFKIVGKNGLPLNDKSVV